MDKKLVVYHRLEEGVYLSLKLMVEALFPSHQLKLFLYSSN